MIRLIVNADDFGRTPEINAGILKTFTDGIVSSASLLPNFPAFDQAVEMHRNNGLPTGIHLNLTEGQPLSPPETVSSLVDASGSFFQKRSFFVRLLQRRLKTDEIRIELTAQLQRCKDAGVQLDHMDSHHHIHAAPLVSRICARLRETFGVPAVRRISPPVRFRASWPIIEQHLIALIDEANLGNHTLSVNQFWGFDLMHAHNKITTLLGILQTLEPGTHELMCHPGFVSSESVGAMNEKRQREVSALCSHAARDMIEHRKIALISYNELEP